ncbi:MAG: Pyruvate dehydrogenase E1 component [bacterium]|nr:Pyruvate dehydrogenase E1 component [bacterium]
MIDTNPQETQAWLKNLETALESGGPSRVRYLMDLLRESAYNQGVPRHLTVNTPYINTITVDDQPTYPGDRVIERRIKSLIRWNAMAMVVNANHESHGIGGHISTYASAATLFEVGFNHFFKAKNENSLGDQVYFQGHASPGIYARAFIEGRLPEHKLVNFRRELRKGGGLPSYPHPKLLPDFWEFPAVSMGLAPIEAIYQARFNRYLLNRGVLDTSNCRVWAFLGDGEMDEPESMGAITLASREELDNLVFVINCNLQRLDGPVRGNGKIIQELEAAFRGAGWNVIKVIWGGDWDPLLAHDDEMLLRRRMEETVDGQYQRYSVMPGDYIREDFFGVHPKLLGMVEHLSDEQLQKMRRGGHDPVKVYAAYEAAVAHRGSPTVILAKTIKGYGLGEAGEGRNISHQQKKLNDHELKEFRDRFDIPIPDEDLDERPFYRPSEDSDEIQYLLERRRALGGFIPARHYRTKKLQAPEPRTFSNILGGSGNRDESTTMSFARILAQLLRDKELGDLIVPIVPDEARTFGLDSLFQKYGIYSHKGQKYLPVDYPGLLYYREAVDGQLIEEGITEAGAMASFIAAGTAYATHDRPMIPFFIYYSMFGFQRVGDLIWAAADQRIKGFMLGATAGRTTLAGEGLQHQDGQSQLAAAVVPTIIAYDPAWAYEIAVIIRDGIRRMYEEGEEVFYYLTLENEPYPQAPIPEGVEEGILRGFYKFRAFENPGDMPRLHLFGSGAILREALRAQEILAEKFNVAADVWSVTSYKELRRDAVAARRWNLFHPESEQKVPYVTSQLQAEPWPVIAASDYVRSVQEMVAPYVPSSFYALGTDGFGRSDARKELRRFFEVDAECITVAALTALMEQGVVSKALVAQAIKDLGIDPEKPDPFAS